MKYNNLYGIVGYFIFMIIFIYTIKKKSYSSNLDNIIYLLPVLGYILLSINAYKHLISNEKHHNIVDNNINEQEQKTKKIEIEYGHIFLALFFLYNWYHKNTFYFLTGFIGNYFLILENKLSFLGYIYIILYYLLHSIHIYNRTTIIKKTELLGGILLIFYYLSGKIIN